MAGRFRQVCIEAGCSNFALPGNCRCAEHNAQRVRETSHYARARRDPVIEGWYRSPRWARMRAGQLAREPLCAMCRREGRITLANTVDHVIPHKGEPALFFDNGNLQSLCARCHSRKTVLEDGGFGNPTAHPRYPRERRESNPDR